MSIETMTKIATYTVGSGGIASYTFTNINQDYTDLIVIGSVRTNRASTDEDGLAMVVNGLTTGYTYRGLIGNGSSASSINTSFEQPWFTRVPASTATANVFGNFKVYIPRYSGYTQKSYYVDGVQENSSSVGYSNLMAITNTTTLPVTTLEFKSATGATMQQYSTITLYGVKNSTDTVGNSIKATGGAISFDGTYVVHTFNSSGTFTPTAGLNVDYLVVAGGGGGANGGGGAGGFRTSAGTSGANSASESKLSLFGNTSYTVTVGAGGAPVSWASSGNDGTSSTFSTVNSLGGGGGGGPNAPGRNGGSGGGAGNIASGAAPAAGNGTANQGLGGGGAVSNGNNQSGGGGGGGASVAGASFGAGGAGGAGLASTISGTSIVYAGGGGAANIAGAGGSGGGGTGGSGTNGAGISGTANTGGGGGGSIFGTHGAGGSGIVIIRYLAQ